MLDRLDLKSVAADCGAEFRRHHMLDGSRKGRSIFAVPVYKDDTCICWSWPEREGNGLSRVEPNSRTTHCIR
jgi:hypothetical protein